MLIVEVVNDVILKQEDLTMFDAIKVMDHDFDLTVLEQFSGYDRLRINKNDVREFISEKLGRFINKKNNIINKNILLMLETDAYYGREEAIAAMIEIKEDIRAVLSNALLFIKYDPSDIFFNIFIKNGYLLAGGRIAYAKKINIDEKYTFTISPVLAVRYINNPNAKIYIMGDEIILKIGDGFIKSPKAKNRNLSDIYKWSIALIETTKAAKFGAIKDNNTIHLGIKARLEEMGVDIFDCLIGKVDKFPKLRVIKTPSGEYIAFRK